MVNRYNIINEKKLKLGRNCMFFDPVSSWLVVLIADGIILSSEKFGGNAARDEYERECIKERNHMLNCDIRRIKKKYGLMLSDMAYDEVKRSINFTRKSYPFNCSRGEIIIDLDNQEYIISLLEACAKKYESYSGVDSKKKADWFRKAAVEAKIKKEQYTKVLAQKELEKQRQESAGCVILCIGLILLFLFVLFIFS
jgi:hypothetical protein